MIYFVEILGYCCMGNHFHLLVRVRPDTNFTDSEIKRRYYLLYGEDQLLQDGQIPFYRHKWSSLSEFMREIKLGFTRFYNKHHGRRGYFWGDRFKSVVVQDGNTLINCLAYIDLNPVRAGLVEKPEDYRWSSIGYHVQAGNRDKLLSLDLGLKEFGVADEKERFRRYRRFLYQAGAIDGGKGAVLDSKLLEKEQQRDFRLPTGLRLLYRTRYFTDSGIIGTREYVRRTYSQVNDRFNAKRDKVPKPISGFNGIYSLKRLTE
jgi:REP element-mobilizing transposase RayT